MHVRSGPPDPAESPDPNGTAKKLSFKTFSAIEMTLEDIGDSFLEDR
jgi:hypothetical protein